MLLNFLAFLLPILFNAKTLTSSRRQYYQYYRHYQHYPRWQRQTPPHPASLPFSGYISRHILCFLCLWTLYLPGCGQHPSSPAPTGPSSASSELHAFMGDDTLFLVSTATPFRYLLSPSQRTLPDLDQHFLFLACHIKALPPQDIIEQLVHLFRLRNKRYELHHPKHCIPAFTDVHSEPTLFTLANFQGFDSKAMRHYVDFLSVHDPRTQAKLNTASFSTGSAAASLFSPTILKYRVASLKYIMKPQKTRKFFGHFSHATTSHQQLNALVDISHLVGTLVLPDKGSTRYLDQVAKRTERMFPHNQSKGQHLWSQKDPTDIPSSEHHPPVLRNGSPASILQALGSALAGLTGSHALIRMGKKHAGYMGALIGATILPTITFFLLQNLHIPADEVQTHLREMLKLHPGLRLSLRSTPRIKGSFDEALAVLGAALQQQNDNRHLFYSYCLPQPDDHGEVIPTCQEIELIRPELHPPQ